MVVATRRERLSFLSRVPDDILIEIFNHVPLRDRIRSQGVCRRFRNVLNRGGWKDANQFNYTSLEFLFTPHEWQTFINGFNFDWRLQVYLWAPANREKALNRLESFFKHVGPSLKEMDLATYFPSILLEFSWRLVASNCTQLEKLKIGIDDSRARRHLSRFGETFPHLVEMEFVRIDECIGFKYCMDSKHYSICQCLKENEQLRVLSLTNLYGDIDCFLNHLPQSLEVLNITGDVNSYCSCTWPSLLKAKECCPGLKKLALTEIDIRDVEKFGCPFDIFERLESLRFTGKELEVFTFRDMPMLRECYLGNWATDQTVETLCVAAPNLVVLELNGIGEISSSALGKICNLRRLEKLSVNHVSEFNDGVLDAISRNGLLTHVAMCSTSVSDVGIQSLLKYCEHLAFIDVSLARIGEESGNYLGEYTRRLNKRLRVKLTCGMNEPPGDCVRLYEHLRSVLVKYKLIDLDPSRCG